MNNWVKCILDDILQYEQPQPYIVKNDEYSDDFKIPVLTAGKSFIIGKTNENFGIYDKLPVIIFDDFTTASQFVNFKFKVKSSAMKILSVRHHSLDIKFFYYLMKTINCPHDTHKRYWISDYSQKEISLPPLAEQGRIVAKIEELFAGIDAGVENLKSVKNQIALYRQSVLKSAFDFDASTFSALKNLIDKVRYGTSKKCSTEENVNSMPVYRIPNIDFKKGILDKTDLKFTSFDDSEKSSLMLKSGDILIIRSNGSLNLVGRAALVYNTDTNGLYAGYLMRLRIKDTEKLLPKFLLHFLNSGKARAYIEEKAKSTSGVNNINSEEISDLQIPVPTLAEQERIVAEIESRFERADALETAVDRALNDAEKLKQAVLKKAFSGELVPQNPDDEPASVLLDRIRAARASELPAKKGKRKKTEVDSQL